VNYEFNSGKINQVENRTIKGIQAMKQKTEA